MPLPAAAVPGRRQFLAGLAAATAASGAGGLLAGCGSSAHAARRDAPGKRHGGDLKVGLTGGSPSDTIDPHKGLTYMDNARQQALYSALVQLDNNARNEFVLAESIEPKDGNPREWMIRLRPGITFHDGKPLTADDVIFSFRRVISNDFNGRNGLGPMDAAGLKKLDARTVFVPFTKPYSSFVDQLAAFWFYLYIAPETFSPHKYNGTGPFRYQSFTPGERSVFTRNPHYFKPGLPYADTITISDFPTSITLQDALITGTIDGAGTLDPSQIPSIATRPGIRTVVSQAGGIVPFTMRVDQKPFNDVRVRQAMRLLVDRPQMIDSALNSYGTVAPDVFSPYDPYFDHSLHRSADIPQAQKLLKAAGKEDLQVELTTSAITTATVALATVLAQQAQQAGVEIRLRQVDPGTFFGPSYLSWEFSQDYYNYCRYLPQAAQSFLPRAPFNETHTANPEYTRWYAEANSTFDPGKQKQILHEMQQFDFTQGGYIIPAYIDSLDAYSTKITGFSEAKVGQPLSNFSFEHFAFVK